ncbi:hypothetical protein, partial [Steroidobacter sp.]|uniref:hypothetical protein n=1 Tax=Steroidobacter sp. TaxID=1978227 RepID=UPI001A3A27F3
MNSYLMTERLWVPVRSVLVTMMLVILAPTTSAMQTAEQVVQRDYVWLTAEQPSGSQTVKVFADGRVSVHFKYNDRGRGPDTTTDMKFDADGVLASYASRGVNHMKGSVDERFEIRRGRAVWSSSLERGEASATPRKLYFPVNHPPEYWAALIRAALVRPDRRIELLPAGIAQVTDVASLALAVEGVSRTATLYEIAGLDIAPTYVWLDERGELVGYGAGWFSILRTQWISHLSVLRSAQKQALDERIRAETVRFRQRVEAPIAIAGVRILDVRSGRLTEPVTVLLRDGLIAGIDATGAIVPTEAHRIEGGGKTLMAALWDLHGHIDPSVYLNYIASGVLNVRDMGNEP